jgi:hypothetical protein
MPEEARHSLADRVRDLRLVQQALANAVRDALRRHKQAGNPVAVWRDGHIVWLDPDDIPEATGRDPGAPP